jgi:hypothetical protein
MLIYGQASEVSDMVELSESQSALIDAFRGAVNQLQREQAAGSDELAQGPAAEQVGTVIRVTGNGVYEIQSPSKKPTIVHSGSLIDLVGTLVKISMVPRGPESLSIFEWALLSVIENFFASFPPDADAGMRSRFEPNAEVAPASVRTVHGESAIEVDPITSSILSLLSAMNKANLEPTVSGEETMNELEQVKKLADRRIAAAKLRIAQAST